MTRHGVVTGLLVVAVVVLGVVVWRLGVEVSEVRAESSLELASAVREVRRSAARDSYELSESLARTRRDLGRVEDRFPSGSFFREGW